MNDILKPVPEGTEIAGCVALAIQIGLKAKELKTWTPGTRDYILARAELILKEHGYAIDWQIGQPRP